MPASVARFTHDRNRAIRPMRVVAVVVAIVALLCGSRSCRREHDGENEERRTLEELFHFGPPVLGTTSSSPPATIAATPAQSGMSTVFFSFTERSSGPTFASCVACV